jgi:hypothetical protein
MNTSYKVLAHFLSAALTIVCFAPPFRVPG